MGEIISDEKLVLTGLVLEKISPKRLLKEKNLLNLMYPCSANLRKKARHPRSSCIKRYMPFYLSKLPVDPPCEHGKQHCHWFGLHRSS